LPAIPLLAAFLTASFILAVTPGPGVFYIIARSTLEGRAHGLASVAGVALGNFGNALGAALGLAALFAISSTAFLIVKWAGAAYLIWLGIKALRNKTAQPGEVPPPAPLSRIFRDGFLVALLNPKTAVFFAAFLPQFITPGAGLIQPILLGALFVAIAAVTDTAYALAASSARGFITAGPFRKAGRWLTGGAFIGLGLLTALTGNRAK